MEQRADEREPGTQSSSQGEPSGGIDWHSYLRFGAMIATSTVVMFGLTYTNTYAWDHVRWSEERVYMALLMGGAMAMIMLVFMRHMYSHRLANLGILALSVVAFSAALWLVRSQRTIEDVSWMKAMIPHHSIAILTSERARISDPRARKLAEQIIESQRREIEEMKKLVRDLEGRRDR